MKRTNKLIRPKEGRVLAGVCLGISKYLGAPVIIVRILFFILLLPGGFPGLVPYLLLWIIMPSEE